MAELVREIMIDASPETIWPFLTDPDKYVAWQGTVADIDPRPGGRYRVFTFGWDQEGHPIPAGSTTIEISLHPEGDKTRVRLVHRDLPDDAISDHGHGWEHYLGRLAVAATGGDAGPDQQ
jgi:uncharacterized protein YndB with AHSA1/START domain